MKVTILGCGTSSGVPRVDGDWGACDPDEPRNRRRRVSILVEAAGTRVLVDTGPDCREQLLSEGGGAPTAVIWTHEHADHCHGLDDLRPFFFASRRPIPAYARARALADIRERFGFAFAGRNGYPSYLSAHALPDRLTIGALAIDVVDMPHGAITSAGLRFGHAGKSVVYTTDVQALPEAAAELARRCDLWIVDCVRRLAHPTHLSLPDALALIERLRPARALLTHMDQSMDYRTLLNELPPKVEPAYDGQAVTL